jgi:hypothetical protein
MPDSISSPRYPIGIVISPGATRTTATKLWAFLWSTEREPEGDFWHRLPPRDKPSSAA